MKKWIHAASDISSYEKHRIDTNGGHLVYLVKDDKIVLYHIEVDTDQRGSGVGSYLLDKLKKVSDDSGMPIELFAIPIKDSQMDVEELIKWYEDRGFQYAGEGMRNELVYLPN